MYQIYLYAYEIMPQKVYISTLDANELPQFVKKEYLRAVRRIAGDYASSDQAISVDIVLEKDGVVIRKTSMTFELKNI
jgi:hypothetical protein